MYNNHPASAVCRRIAPSKRQVKGQARKPSRNKANWAKMADSRRYNFPVVIRHRTV